MTMREGGTTFEAARNGGLTPLERRLSTKVDYDLGKNAWNASSRIWGTSKSFLDGAVDDAPLRPSPVRQSSLSNYARSKTTANTLRTPTESNNENSHQSKTLWNSVPTSIGFTSKPAGQPLSPTKQRQNQLRDFTADNSNGTRDQSSLFAGSDPDVDDIPLDVQQAQTSRRAQPAAGRALPSPPRPMTFGSSQLDPQIQALNSRRHHVANGRFASIADFESNLCFSVNGSQQVNGNMDVLPLLKGHDAFGPVDAGSPTTVYEAHSRLPADGRVAEHLVNSAHLESQFRPLMNQGYDDAVGSFERMTIYEAATVLMPQRIPQHQLHHQQDENHAPMHSGYPDNKLADSSSHVQSLGSRLNPQASPHYGNLQHGGRGTYPLLANDYRSNLNSPYYSATGTPPTGPQSIRSTPGSGMSSRTSHHDPFIFDRKFGGSSDHYMIDPSAMVSNAVQPSMTHGFQYDARIPGHAMRMNPLAHPYIAHGPGATQNYPSGPRMPTREPEQAHIVRSPLLEEFRLNSKHNRRYELKDIYGYVVEFSGDQHGSRFIQQKLETANSDEKEQIFNEIQADLLQLMTDVFGNYVIQKMFEHGNQTQKKILAHHMKGHVLDLSMQMYGCRVVQKAFEHVLNDQQASLVKELDGPNLQVLKVVKDQNGNHVVQKAIERIPGAHIQFIVDAHRGQMAKMSTHQYGCRVVQRMLEHCQPPTKRVILDELLEHIHPLISDSYGNYVVQHIIQNGEPRDRRQVVDIILQQLLTFSKHKFASNIVEKSMDCADADQREEILRGLIGPDEQGVTPVLGLMRDQYGNYVLQKVFSQLQGHKLASLRADMQRNYPILRRTSYGKQVMAIEKLLFGNSGPPLQSQSPPSSSRSSTLPGTDQSSSTDSDAHSLQQADAK